MEYSRHFFITMKSAENDFVVALNIPQSCAMAQIPSEFRYCLPNIVDILNHNKKKLCKKNEIIAVFGLQVTSAPLVSDTPKNTGRIISKDNPNIHFCCNLDYLPIPPHKKEKITSWRGSKTIAIDFTTGIVMNNSEYINRLFHKDCDAGIIYGYLEPALLTSIWRMVIESNKYRSMRKLNGYIN